MRVVDDMLDSTLQPLADVGTLTGVTLQGPAAGIESSLEPTAALQRPEDAPQHVLDDADRMRAAGFRLERGVWRR